jgi:hypothetical protein
VGGEGEGGIGKMKETTGGTQTTQVSGGTGSGRVGKQQWGKSYNI